MSTEITTMEELLGYLDEFIGEISCHTGYRDIVHIMENPMIILLSQITGYQPGYFGKPINGGEYVMFDVEKIKQIRERLGSIRRTIE